MLTMLECLLVPAAAASFYVNWVSAGESLKVFTYDTVTQSFTETEFASGRCAIYVFSSSIVFLIGFSTVLTFSNSGLVNCNELSEFAKADVPRLEFIREVNGRPAVLATVSQDWLYVPKFTESDTIPVGTDMFRFFAGATIETTGMTAKSLVEGILT